MKPTRTGFVSLGFCLVAAHSLIAAEAVRVTNFPKLQRVQVEQFPELQAVRVQDHPAVTRFVSWPGQRVAPVSPSTGPDDLERLHELGSLDASGFASLALAAAGQLSGSTGETHRVELILLPDTQFIRDSWKDDGVLLLESRIPLELKLDEKGLFEARAEPIVLRFPRYLAFIRNSSLQAIDLDIYAQLGE